MRFGVLGPIDVEVDGVSIPIVGPQQRRLVSILVAERGRVVSTDRLVDALWPDGHAPDGAPRSVLTYVSRLRATLGGNGIVTSPPGYLLQVGTGSCDADEFEALLDEGDRALPERALDCYDAALRLWRGTPFGEFAGEWWAVAESARLTERYVVGREERAQCLMALGQHHRAVAELEGLVGDHPLRERPVSLLMESLQATGRQAEALRAYRSFRDRLVDETGLEPSAALDALERSIVVDEDAASAGSSRRLRGYVIHDAVGQGAVGRVYAATQPGTNRRVAIKVIRPELADSASFVRRFEAEAQLVARLEHPHILPLYDFWREPGAAYLVFRLLSGGTARDAVVVDGAWSVARVSRLVEEIGAALMAAHSAGVTHNDVRSSNVLLDTEGAAYLADFGIALELGDQVDAEMAVVDDVQDFGWMLWELLAGSPARGAHRRGTPLAGPPPTLVGRVGAIPEGLDAVLARATAEHGGYRSVAELVLGWRAAVGSQGAALTPLDSDEHRAVDSARRSEARQLARTVAAEINPYKGLRPFDEGDASVFHGRESVLDELATRLAERSFVAVVGASGSGKSSLVRAGLGPRLRASGQTVVTMVPGDRPVDALMTALREVSTVEIGAADPLAVLAAIGASAGPVVLFVDQFEECWTRCAADRRDAFLEVLVGVVDGDTGTTRVVTTVRADLFDRPLEDPRIGQLVGDGAFVLGAMTPAQIGEAVTQPAARAGVVFDDAVLADLVSGTANQPGALPLLQFALTELYDRRVDGRIGVDALAAVGGVAGAVARRADAVFEPFGEAERLGARELFARLVVPGSDGVDARRRARLSELSPTASQAAEAFVAARLLVTDRDRSTREPTLEVAHESLLTRWPTLAGWIDEDRRWLAQVQHLADAARSWDENGRADSELYRGSRLEAAIEAVEHDGRAVSALEQAFVTAGRTARDAEVVAAKRQARRLRRLLAGVATALVIAVVAGAVAVVQQRRADDAADDARAAQRDAQVEALVGRSEAIRATQRDTSALLAIAAYQLADTARTRSALFSTFTENPGFLDAHRFDQVGGGAGVVMPDGVTAFVEDAEGRVHPYDLETGERGPAWPALGQGATRVETMLPSADGRRLVQLAHTTDGDTVAGVFDVRTADLVVAPIRIDGPVESAAIGDDDRTLFVTSAGTGSSAAIDLTTGRVVGEVPGTEGGGGLATLAGNRLAVGSDAAIRILDATSLGVMTSVEAPPGTTSTLRRVGDGPMVVGSGFDGLVMVDADSGTVVWEVINHAGTCGVLAVVEEADAVFCGDVYGRLVERDLRTGAFRRNLDAQNGSVGSLWSSSDGTELVSFGDHEPVVSRWRLDGSGPVTRVLEAGWNAVQYSPDGTKLIVGRTASRGDQADTEFVNKVIDVATGGDIASLEQMVSATWFDNETIGGGYLTETGLGVASFDLRTGRLDVNDDAEPPAFAPTDPPEVNWQESGQQRVLVANIEGADAEIWPIDRTGRRTEPTIRTTNFSMFAASLSGHRIAVASDTGVTVYDGSSGEPLGRTHGSDERGVFITPGGQLITSTLGGELTVYDLDTLDVTGTLGGSRGFVQEAESTIDGATVVVRGGDRFVSVYDIASGVQIGTAIQLGDDDVRFVALAQDGDEMAIGGGFSQGLRIWDLRPDAWVDAACRLAGRNLTTAEWASHIGELAEYRAICPQFALPDA